MKRQPTEWEKILANEATKTGFISKIYNHLMQLNIRKKTTQSKNRQNIYTFLQRRQTDDQKAHENMLNINNYYRNVNQNYNEISPHTSENYHYENV